MHPISLSITHASSRIFWNCLLNESCNDESEKFRKNAGNFIEVGSLGMFFHHEKSFVTGVLYTFFLMGKKKKSEKNLAPARLYRKNACLNHTITNPRKKKIQISQLRKK